MKLTVDTNVLVRAIVQDDLEQAVIAAQILREADQIAVPTAVLCEFVWVLTRVYGFARSDVAAAITRLVDSPNVHVNGPAVKLGLDVFLNGADFADGAIVSEGQWLGGETFVSFDKAAVKAVLAQGHAAQVL